MPSILRYLFMRGLIDHERDQRCHHYLKSAAEFTSRAILSLELADEPITSVKQARMLEGIGGETCKRLKNLEKERALSCVKPLGARFVSSAGGILVGLLDATEEMIDNGSSPEKNVLVAEDSVKQRAIRLTEEPFCEGPNGFCKAWWRLEVLIKRGYIRRHSYKKSPFLHLLPLGKVVAVRLRTQIGLISTVPIKPSSCVIPSTKVSALTLAGSWQGNKEDQTKEHNSWMLCIQMIEDMMVFSCRQNKDIAFREQLPLKLAFALTIHKSQGMTLDRLVMLVDRRELGGEQLGLRELLGLLNDIGIVYKTGHLKAGDYSWLWRVSGREVVLPCLVERKRADDIARTLKEGRFWSQVNKMKDWKDEFTRQGIECGIHYVLERKPEEYVVKCADGCQGIVQCGNPTLTQVKMVIEDLKRHPDLQVKETNSLYIIVKLLASMTAELAERIKNGDFDKLLQRELTEADNYRDKLTEMEDETKCKQFSKFNGDVQLIEHHDSDDNRLKEVKEEITFDEKLELDDAKSRKDVTALTNFTKSEHDRSDATVLEHFPYGELDEDAELALVLKRSKHETLNLMVPYKDNIGRQHKSTPLMQYHCSAGGSLKYPKQFIPLGSQEKPNISQHGKVHGQLRSVYQNDDSRIKDEGISDTEFKMCTNSTSTTSLRKHSEDFVRTREPQNMYRCFQDNLYSDHAENSSVPRLVISDSNEKTSVPKPGNQSLNSSSNLNHVWTAGKRKYYKKEFKLVADDSSVEQLNSNDSDDTGRKRNKTIQLNFTPAREFIETNVIKSSFRGNFSTKANSSRLSMADRCSRVEKGTCEATDCLDQESVATEGYNSDEDLFEDKAEDIKCVASCSYSSQTSQKTSQCGNSKISEGLDTSKLQSSHGKSYKSVKIYERNRSRSENEKNIFGVSELDKKECFESEEVDGFFSQQSSSEESLPDIGLDLNPVHGFINKTHVGHAVDDTCTTEDTQEVSLRSESTRDWRYNYSYDSESKIECRHDHFVDQLKLVMSVLPLIYIQTVQQVLRRCHGNIEMCISQLLDENVQH